jgi:hypothetical protein
LEAPNAQLSFRSRLRATPTSSTSPVLHAEEDARWRDGVLPGVRSAQRTRASPPCPAEDARSPPRYIRERFLLVSERADEPIGGFRRGRATDATGRPLAGGRDPGGGGGPREGERRRARCVRARGVAGARGARDRARGVPGAHAAGPARGGGGGGRPARGRSVSFRDANQRIGRGVRHQPGRGVKSATQGHRERPASQRRALRERKRPIHGVVPRRRRQRRGARFLQTQRVRAEGTAETRKVPRRSYPRRTASRGSRTS